MKLKSLELQGFKSFPDKTVIEFSNGITSIVGPNGSGKSNIADALRWVMGETKTKELRAGKMEDVIFDGTKTRKAMGYAQVTMTFDNSDRELDIDFSEVSISRRYYRSGESEYYLNGAQVRLKDIQSLLRDTGLGRTGYSIIGQNAITEILNAKSQDRRVVFEEAAGIAGFKYRRDESSKKLMATNDNIVRLSDILAELASRLPSLEKQSEKAKKYIALRDEKKILDIGIWLYEDVRINEKTKALDEKIDIIDSDLKNFEMRLAFIDDAQNESQDKIETINTKIDDTRDDINEVEKQIHDFETSIKLCENDISHANEDLNRIETEIAESNKNKDELLADIEKLKKDLQNNDILRSKCEESIAAVKDELSKKAGEESGFYKQLNDLKDRLADILQQRNGISVTLAGFTQKKQDIEEDEQNIENEINDGKERLFVLKKSGASLESELKEIDSKIEENQNMLRGQQMKYDLQQSKVEKISNEYNELNIRLAKEDNRLNILNEMERNHEGFSGSVQAVIKEAKRGILSGIIGPVAEIINVPSEYTIAIETALGPAIQNIVTENDSDAKNAVYYLKTKNAGRATFLPISSIKGKNLDRSLDKEAGFIGIASELVEYDKRFDDIVRYLLGRTAVSDNLDSANKIAKKYNYTFRIVTLDGQVVNAGGSITGGSVSKNVGVFSRKNEISQLQISTKELRADLEKKSKESSDLRSEFDRLTLLLENLRGYSEDLAKQKIEKKASLDHNSEYISNVEMQLRSLQNSLESNKETLAKIKEEETKLQIDDRSLSGQETDINGQVEKIESSNEYLKAERDELEEKINKYNLELVNINHEREVISADVERRNEAIFNQDEFVEKSLAEQNSIRDKIKEYNDQIEQLNRSIEKAKESTSQIEADRKKLIEERAKLEREINEYRAEEKDINDKKTTSSVQLERLKAEKTSSVEKLNALQTKLWDEYEVTPSEAKESYAPAENISEATSRSDEIKGKLRALGEVNISAIDEYVDVKARHDELDSQIKDLNTAKTNLEDLIRSLENDMRKIFTEKFKVISAEFERVFKILFSGGEARLSLSEGEDILECGIEIHVAPPGKVIKNISALSGGEQALAATALYFALLKINPSPFCLLDEIEASLDEQNVLRVAEYMYNLTKDTQIIAVTHRRGTMEVSDRLYGVTMREKGVSKIITINVSEIEKELEMNEIG